MKKFEDWWRWKIESLKKVDVNWHETERHDETARESWNAALRFGKDSSSWFSGLCKECGYNVVVTQSKKFDYFWYCSNKYCKHHEGHEAFDDEDIDWVN